MKQILFTKEASRALDRIPTNVGRLIRAKLAAYAQAPSALANNVKTLQGGDRDRRLRVGDWRIVFKEDSKTIRVFKIASRGSAYD